MNGVDLQLFNRRFVAIADEMGEVLRRGAFSPNIKERQDHSCAVFDASGDTIAQAAHIPVHLGAAPSSVKAVIAEVNPGDGETAVVNDPFAGGTHLPDITLVTCVEVDGSRFYVASRAHHADIGGISPGSLPLSESIHDEGWRCPPALLSDELERGLLSESRTPDERIGDLAAQKAANRVGATRLRELCSEHGTERVEAAARAVQDWTQRIAETFVAGVPDGVYRCETWLEGPAAAHEPAALRLELSVSGSALTFDFTQTDAQIPGPMNAVRAITESAVFYVLLVMLRGEAPPSAGVMRVAEVKTQPGTLADAAYPAAVAAGNVETSQRLVDLVFAAFSEALPGQVPADACGSMNNVLIGSLEGAARPWVYYETIAGGQGGAPDGDGASALHAHMTNTLNTPVEAFEHAYPVRISELCVRRGSGGSGRHRGGDGVVRAYEFLEPAEVTLLAERRHEGPQGRDGGRPGASGKNELITAAGVVSELPGKVTLKVGVGDVIRVMTPGGGGWGSE